MDYIKDILKLTTLHVADTYCKIKKKKKKHTQKNHSILKFEQCSFHTVMYQKDTDWNGKQCRP